MAANEDGRAPRRKPKAMTKATIRAKALEVALTGPEPLERLPRVADILDALGMTTGSAYQIWPSQQAFWHDLAAAICEHGWADEDGQIQTRVIRLQLGFPLAWGLADKVLESRWHTAQALGITVDELDAKAMAALMGELREDRGRYD